MAGVHVQSWGGLDSAHQPLPTQPATQQCPLHVQTELASSGHLPKSPGGICSHSCNPRAMAMSWQARCRQLYLLEWSAPVSLGCEPAAVTVPVLPVIQETDVSPVLGQGRAWWLSPLRGSASAAGVEGGDAEHLGPGVLSEGHSFERLSASSVSVSPTPPPRFERTETAEAPGTGLFPLTSPISCKAWGRAFAWAVPLPGCPAVLLHSAMPPSTSSLASLSAGKAPAGPGFHSP